MRISDWSSDVCSSDLNVTHDRFRQLQTSAQVDIGPITLRAGYDPGAIIGYRGVTRAGRAAHRAGADTRTGSATVAPAQGGIRIVNQRGRGSWRERVCQYE